jgi:hypothetical protein
MYLSLGRHLLCGSFFSLMSTTTVPKPKTHSK